jgi:hypothetical protein
LLRAALRPTLLGVCGFAVALSAHRGARAEGANVAAADALFRDGKAKMAAEDYAQACPKLADSYRLDPATGTLLALALCHEREGKMASAWVEYADAAMRAKKEGRADREKAARERVAALEPKLSQLTIAAPVASSITGFAITRNGVTLGASAMGIAVPVDGGTYAIEASAPHKKPWRAKVTVAATGDRQSITVPTLEDDKTLPSETKPRKLPPLQKGENVADRPPAAALASSATATAPGENPAPAKHGFGWVDTTAIAAGVVGLGVGTAFMLQAIGKNEQSEAGCAGDVCTAEARQDRLDALDAGRVATVAFAAGGALVATGLTIYLVGGATSSRENGVAKALQAAPVPLAGGFGGMLRGNF